MNDIGERLREAARRLDPSEDAFEQLARRRDRRRRRDRLTAGAVALVLALAGIGGAVWALQRTNGGSNVPGDVRSPADRLAMGGADLLYLKTSIQLQDGRLDIETWWAADDSGRTEATCEGDCSDYGPPPTGTFGPGELPLESDLSALSTDPAELEDQLLARTAPGGASPEPAVSPGPELTPGVTAGGLWYAVDRLLELPNAAPELRAALFEVFAGLPGAEVTEGLADPAGRPAIRIVFAPQDGPPISYFFDPGTRQLMAREADSMDAARPWSTVLDEGIVQSVDERPSADQLLFPIAA